MVALLTVQTAWAHDVITTKITWSREISRIFVRRCMSCHHEGGKAFALTAYAEARPWAEAIKEQVLARKMPPWNAVKGFGEFRNDPSLTQEEMERVADWVVGGAPEGDAKLLPKLEWRDPGKVQGKFEKVEVTGEFTVKKAMVVAGIRAGGDLQVVARRSDGAVEPLVWLREFTPGLVGEYWFREAKRLGVGCRVEVRGGGRVELLVGREAPPRVEALHARVRAPQAK